MLTQLHSELHGGRRAPFSNRFRTHLPWFVGLVVALVLIVALPGSASAHGVGEDDGSFLATNQGLAAGPYAYLGAKHMFTGYDHLLFLAGVIFFLFRLRDVALYVSLFALGHSVTLIFGVLADLSVNAYLVDAVIGLSVVYKGFDNIGGFAALSEWMERRFGTAPRWLFDQRLAVLFFGLIHGFGLATKLQPLGLSRDGLIGNMVSFNVGVEVGQIAALVLMLLFFQLWRASGRFQRHAFVANSCLMVLGFLLAGYQMAGFWVGA